MKSNLIAWPPLTMKSMLWWQLKYRYLIYTTITYNLYIIYWNYNEHFSVLIQSQYNFLEKSKILCLKLKSNLLNHVLSWIKFYEPPYGSRVLGRAKHFVFSCVYWHFYFLLLHTMLNHFFFKKLYFICVYTCYCLAEMLQIFPKWIDCFVMFSSLFFRVIVRLYLSNK